MASIYMQLRNYRKPLEQRLIVRIQLMIPLYAISCFVSLCSSFWSQFVEPIREIYEAFVIYTFFNLLTVMLGGERNILHFTAGRDRTDQPWPVSLLGGVDISDPHHFVWLKRGVLQYVWLKPILCLTVAATQVTGVYDVNKVGPASVYVWITISYNLTVTISLYCLAMFWKCLYSDLKPFNPWGKFLCVKLIIFASYWQGVILAILNYFNLLPQSAGGNVPVGQENNLGISIQNALLCFELIFFSIGHWYSFHYGSFTMQSLPNCSRMTKWAAWKDCTGVVDLVVDFKNITNNEFWSYRHFDSVENFIAEERSKIKRINQGMRYSHGGTQKYWLPSSSSASNNNNTNDDEDDGSAIDEEPLVVDFFIIPKAEFDRDDKLYNYAKRHYPFGDRNYPVVIEKDSYMYSKNFQAMRNNAALKYGQDSNNTNNNINDNGNTIYGSI